MRTYNKNLLKKPTASTSQNIELTVVMASLMTLMISEPSMMSNHACFKTTWQGFSSWFSHAQRLRRLIVSQLWEAWYCSIRPVCGCSVRPLCGIGSDKIWSHTVGTCWVGVGLCSTAVVSWREDKWWVSFLCYHSSGVVMVKACTFVWCVGNIHFYVEVYYSNSKNSNECIFK